MTRVTIVAKAQKDQGPCGRCRKEIRRGDSYRHWKFRHGSLHKRCMDPACNPKGSELTNNDKRSRVLAAQEDVEEAVARMRAQAVTDADAEDLRGAVSGAAEVLREVAEEYQTSCDNIRESFAGGSPTADECEEKAQALEAVADELDGWACEDFDKNEDDFEDDARHELEGSGDEVDPEDLAEKVGQLWSDAHAAWIEECVADLEGMDLCPI